MSQQEVVQSEQADLQVPQTEQPSVRRGNFRGRGQQGRFAYVKKNATEEEKQKDQEAQQQQTGSFNRRGGNFRGRGQQGGFLYVKKNATEEEKQKEKEAQLEQIQRNEESKRQQQYERRFERFNQEQNQFDQNHQEHQDQDQHYDQESGTQRGRFNERGRFRGRGGRGGRGRGNRVQFNGPYYDQEWDKPEEQPKEKKVNQKENKERKDKKDDKGKKPEVKLTKEQIRSKELEDEILKYAETAKNLEDVKKEKAVKTQVKEGRKVDASQFSNMQIANKSFTDKREAAQSSTNIEYMYRPETLLQKSQLVSFQIQQKEEEQNEGEYGRRRGNWRGERRGGRGGRGRGARGGEREERGERGGRYNKNQGRQEPEFDSSAFPDISSENKS